MDWSLLGCGASGHVTFAPDEPALRDRLGIATREGPAWRCLRCGTFVVGEPTAGGPAASAPPVRRAEQVRSALILRIFAVERFLRALIVVALAVAVWRFSVSRLSLEQAYDQALPPLKALLRDLGFSVEHSKLLGLLHEAFTANSRTLGFIAIGLGAYAVIETIEGVGLWLLKRWGEYFAMIATSLGLPYEIYELMDKVTVLRVVAFVINLGLVLYLVLTKRLFGVRGGRKAYEARLRSESILDAEIAALAAGQDAPGQAAAEGNAAPVAEAPVAGPPWPDAEPPAAAGNAAPVGDTPAAEGYAAPVGDTPAAEGNAAPVAETPAAGPPWPDAEPPADEASAAQPAPGEAPAPAGPPPASGEPTLPPGEAPAEAEPMDGTTAPVTTEASDADEADVPPLPRRHSAR
jgi:uncharacterized membrane protein (DUF2068 family)